MQNPKKTQITYFINRDYSKLKQYFSVNFKIFVTKTFLKQQKNQKKTTNKGPT